MPPGSSRWRSSASWWLGLACASAWAACTFDWDQYEPPAGANGGAGTTTSGGGEMGGAGAALGGGGSTQGGSGGLGGSAGGAGAATLVDVGLIARYYIDVSPTGPEPLELEDAAPEPLPLALSYVAPDMMTFVEEGGHRGLYWPQQGADSRACAPVAGTKVEAALDGRTAATIEVVARVEGTSSQFSRLSDIGHDQLPDLSLRMHTLTQARFDWNTALVGVWPVDFEGLGRLVLHLVLDTSHNNAANRVRLYLNGTKVNSASMTPPAQGGTTAFDPTSSHCLGNRPIGERSIAGTIFYAALYSEPLSEVQLELNTKVLLNNDDVP